MQVMAMGHNYGAQTCNPATHTPDCVVAHVFIHSLFLRAKLYAGFMLDVVIWKDAKQEKIP